MLSYNHMSKYIPISLDLSGKDMWSYSPTPCTNNHICLGHMVGSKIG